MLEWLLKGGPMMWPILICSITALAVAVEKGIYLWRIKLETKKFMDEISDSLKRNRVMDAIEICEKNPSPLSNILKSGILKYDRTHQEIRQAIEDAAIREIPALEKNIGILATITQISPLLGLLGTVLGMVEVFQEIQEKAGILSPVTPADISMGVWQALIATVAGLAVAIPALTAYNYFVNRVNNFRREMEIGATQLISILSEKRAE
ncbi:MAG: MotA/TolQ/ExbB proton channel family protein [Candidatus Omnitrophota bacterium]